jgi:hypothetical protein
MRPAGRRPCDHELRQASFIVIATTGETKLEGKEDITPRETCNQKPGSVAKSTGYLLGLDTQ